MSRTTRTADLDVTEGRLKHGMPYLALGSGQPLVFLRWFTADHANPTGWMRSAELKTLAPLARNFRVYAVGRAPDMAAGTTMADIATEHADALHAEFGGAVDVLGVSSGGSIALQLAADHPAAVRRLVIASSGYRLERAASAAQVAYGEAAARGDRALHHMASAGFANPLVARLAAAGMWLLDPLARPKNPADTLAFVRAEDAFDLDGRLADIQAPTLVVGGERDGFYPAANFRHTADGIPHSHLVIYPGASHMGAVKHARFAPDVTDFLTR
ncbi:alpha/beta fold hydrolase [Nocardia sp. NPDC127579]|uniref:alpha/beta fold hydrolase n=1 Tax=Nocardia sp. NPDC127579 TaxID=3345402 RepID=UPI003624EBF8